MSPFKSIKGRALGKMLEGFKSSDIGKGFGSGGGAAAGQFEMATVKFYGTDGNLSSTSLYTRDSFLTGQHFDTVGYYTCLLYTSPSPRDKRQSRMPSSA